MIYRSITIESSGNFSVRHLLLTFFYSSSKSDFIRNSLISVWCDDHDHQRTLHNSMPDSPISGENSADREEVKMFSLRT